ncbi:hypothetical protein BGZ50_009583 [Haplosporangium sp. Z 11]|nr:hypothetical protein BGZ50_009583 [Haplosporangium sp. Z 11]
MTNAFSDIDADQIILWRVFIPIIEDNDEFSILFDNVLDNVLDKYRKKLGSATRLSKVFSKDLPDETVHITSSILLSDASRPVTSLSGDPHTDIKKTTGKFFAPGSDAANFPTRLWKTEEHCPSRWVYPRFAKRMASRVRSSTRNTTRLVVCGPFRSIHT